MSARLRACLVLPIAIIVGELFGAGCYRACPPGQVRGDTFEDPGAQCHDIIAPIPPAISLHPASVSLSASQGGANPGVRSITIDNSGGGTLSGLGIGTIDYHGGPTGWIQAPVLVTATNGGAFALIAMTGALPAGTFTATIPVSAVASNSPQNLEVTFEVRGPACTVILDPFDADAGWTTTATIGSGSPTQSVAFQATGGNPGTGGYRQMRHIFAGLGSISVFHDYTAAIYNPSVQGAIDHINYYEDQIELNPPTPGAAVGTGFTLMQGGTRYNITLGTAGAFTNTIWQTASLTQLKAANFPAGLNFSSTGGPITFGYFRSNTNTGGGSYTITHGIDNWRVEVCR